MSGKILYNLRFPRASTHLVVGPSGSGRTPQIDTLKCNVLKLSFVYTHTGSGKTHRVARILQLKDDIIEGGDEIKNVVFFYDIWQPVYQQLQDEGVVSKWIRASPTNETFTEAVEPYARNGGSIVVIDDFERDAASADLAQIVRVSSRHNNASVFLLFQNLFPPQRHAREISLNVKFLHIHKNPRENAQIQYLARQLSPQSYKWIVDAFHMCTRTPFSAFLVDLDQQRENCLRFRSHYLPEEAPMRVWFERGTKMPMFK